MFGKLDCENINKLHNVLVKENNKRTYMLNTDTNRLDIRFCHYKNGDKQTNNTHTIDLIYKR